MQAKLPRLRKQLTDAGFEIRKVSYKINGRIAFVGFDIMKKGKVLIEVEPMAAKLFMVYFKSPYQQPIHYAHQNAKSQPIGTKPIIQMKLDIFEYLKIE